MLNVAAAFGGGILMRRWEWSAVGLVSARCQADLGRDEAAKAPGLSWSLGPLPRSEATFHKQYEIIRIFIQVAAHH